MIRDDRWSGIKGVVHRGRFGRSTALLEKGVELARAAGFDARGRLASGKTSRAICDVAEELDASAIVLGARGLSRLQSVLLGSVSGAVAGHANGRC